MVARRDRNPFGVSRYDLRVNRGLVESDSSLVAIFWFCLLILDVLDELVARNICLPNRNRRVGTAGLRYSSSARISRTKVERAPSITR